MMFDWLRQGDILTGLLEIVITHGRVAYQPTTIRRWEKGICFMAHLLVVSDLFHRKSQALTIQMRIFFWSRTGRRLI
jgi:hypothetical protein